MMPDYREIAEALERDRTLTRVPAAAVNPTALAAFAAKRFHAKPLANMLVVVPEQFEAEELFEALKAFTPAINNLLEPWDVLPFEPSSLEQSLAASRVEALCALAGINLGADKAQAPRVIVASVKACARMTLPTPLWRKLCRKINYAEELSPRALKAALAESGYAHAAEVTAPGEFVSRGGLLDFYSPGNPWPARIAWDGDLIESIRFFDPATQRTIDTVESVNLLPPRELHMPTGEEERAAACEAVMKSVSPSLRRERFTEAIRAGAMIEGMELFQPFFSETASVFSLGKHKTVIFDRERVSAKLEELHEEAVRESTESDLGFDPSTSWLATLPESLVYDEARSLPEEGSTMIATEPLPPSQVDARVLRTDLRRLIEIEDRIVILTSFPSRVKELLAEERIPKEELAIVESRFRSGCRLPTCGIAVIGDEDLFGRDYRRIRKGGTRRSGLDWRALTPGDYVAHVHHGVGIFRGIERIRSMGEERDVILIEYAGEDKLYIPPYETGLIEKYTVLEGQTPRIDRLGAATWSRLRERAEREAADIARELLDLYALRGATKGMAYGEAAEEKSFARSFGYDETEDQHAAIADVLNELAKTTAAEPMDRLVCGDVGFGKTEVALRAAFRVVKSGKQVAVLCPTTVLALQHTETFNERMRPFGIAVATLSRFQSAAETKATLEQLACGKVDIVVGTHKLLGAEIRFNDLGLLVVDEEQRFGVKHKEKLKNMRRKVDVLTLTATPIPRTLHLALSGARSLSVIETPPPGRAPVQTVVEPYNEEHLRRAVRREIERGGQVFYVHNRIDTIERVVALLKRLFPKLSIAVAHGAMDEKTLSRTMLDFISGKISILVSTSIIENGLDIPKANTLIVDQAERFGLSQLYQLRGRVGRSQVRAYAYFFHSNDMTQDGRARLAAIAEHTALGSGYAVARRDMGIRGAGEILGVLQHGEMEAVGYDMYCRLLREAIAELKGDTLSARAKKSVVELMVPAFIPFEWLGGEELVGAVHKEIASAGTVAEVNALRESLIDRFGALPHSVENLVSLALVRAYAALDNVASIYETDRDLRIKWTKVPAGLERAIMSMKDPMKAAFEGDTLVVRDVPKGAAKFDFLRRLIRR